MASVNFQIMSDLHLETHPDYDFDIAQTAPYLALLGDIGHVNNDQLFRFLERQARLYKIVFYLFGNHEPYHLKIPFAKKKVRDFAIRIDRIRARNASIGRFVFLDQARYDINDTLTVLGCTLHSRILPEQAAAVGSRMVDFKDILDWSISDHVDAHLSDLAWLNGQVEELTKSEPDRRLIIFTHHSPTLDARAHDPRYRTSEVTSGFATDLSEKPCWQSPSVVLWAFGHTHYNCDFLVDEQKRVLANQRGYYLSPKETFRLTRVYAIKAGKPSQGVSSKQVHDANDETDDAPP